MPEEGVEPLLAATDANPSQPTPIEKADPTGLSKPLPLERSASSEAEMGEVRGRFWTAMLTARFRLTLAALPGEPPPLVRLRAALKTLLRRYRLRCEAVEESTNQEVRVRSSRAEPCSSREGREEKP